jgi:hypothetical protein
MHLIRGFTALLITLCLGCGDASSEPKGEETSGDEVPGELQAESSAEAPSETAPAASNTNPHALPADASEALHQAEWLREEQVRLERALEIHMGRHDIPCAPAKDTRDEVCMVADRICALVADDAAVAGRCEEARVNCQRARDAVSGGGCKG